MKNVILIGDSIRMGYQDTVRAQLAGLVDVWGPEANGGTSENVLANLDEWAMSRQADVVHINCGLHDIKTEPGQDAKEVPLATYARNVRSILTQLQAKADTTVIWASSTPVNQECHQRTKPFHRFEADVIAYNAAALAVAKELGVLVDDLFAVVTSAGRDELLIEDGVHFTPSGCDVLGVAVADCIKGVLA